MLRFLERIGFCFYEETEALRGETKKTKKLGKIGTTKELALGNKMSVNLHLLVAKYACSEGWERV